MVDKYTEIEDYLIANGFPDSFKCENCKGDIPMYGVIEGICLAYEEDGLGGLKEHMKEEDFSSDCETCYFWYYPEETDPEEVKLMRKLVANFIATI